MAKTTLQTLPAELRNSIYELAFTCDEGPIDLYQTAPPSKALILTCRQIYNEAKQIYVDAYRRYWSTTSFDVALTRKIEADEKKSIAALESCDLQRATRLPMSARGCVLTLTDIPSVWRRRWFNPGEGPEEYCIACRDKSERVFWEYAPTLAEAQPKTVSAAMRRGTVKDAIMHQVNRAHLL